MFYAQQRNRCICIHRGKTLDLDRTLAYWSVVFGEPDHGEIRFNDSLYQRFDQTQGSPAPSQ